MAKKRRKKSAAEKLADKLIKRNEELGKYSDRGKIKRKKKK